MILAKELEKYTTLDRYEIRNILADSGYTGMSFESVKFVGLTSNGAFCYTVTYFDDNGLGEETGQVYVRKTAEGKIEAEF